MYLTRKVQPKTAQTYRIEKIENKEHKANCLTGKVPQPKATKWYPTQKIEKKQHKVKCLTGKVPQWDKER